MYRITLKNSRRNSGEFLGHIDKPKYDKKKNLDCSGHIGYFLNWIADEFQRRANSPLWRLDLLG